MSALDDYFKFLSESMTVSDLLDHDLDALICQRLIDVILKVNHTLLVASDKANFPW